jgi:hypothetical protein
MGLRRENHANDCPHSGFSPSMGERVLPFYLTNKALMIATEEESW